MSRHHRHRRVHRSRTNAMSQSWRGGSSSPADNCPVKVSPRRADRRAFRSRSQISRRSRPLVLPTEPPGEEIHLVKRARKGSYTERRRRSSSVRNGLCRRSRVQRPLIEASVVLCGQGRQSRPRTHDGVCRTDSDENGVLYNQQGGTEGEKRPTSTSFNVVPFTKVE